MAQAARQKGGEKRHRRHTWRWIGGGGLLLVGLLGMARLALPWYLESYVNRTIDRSPDYGGRIGHVEVHLWRGAYTIHELKIVKKTNAVPVPLYDAPQVDFSLYWGALVHRRLRGKILMQSP